MGTQEGLPTSGVWREDGLVALNKIAVKDHAQAWMKRAMMKSAIAPLQPQHEPVLESVDGSLATLCYQVARNSSFCVAHKALASLEDNVIKEWATTINLGPSVEALERELKSVMVIFELTLGKVIHNMALEGMLMELREIMYEAEDVLDEMEYFCIQSDVLDEMEYFCIQSDVLDTSHNVEGCAHHNLDLNVLPSIHDKPPQWRFDRNNASRRIEYIVKKMQLKRQEVSSTITLLGSHWSTIPNIAQSRPITISESIEPKLYGRDLMMKSIIHDITKGKHSAKVLTVIPIVGPGGIGKTHLAQHIYHTGEVQEHFNVKVWTCVSLNFSVNKLMEDIQGYIPKVDPESSNATASELIGQRLKNKRLLLVLDDIWDCSDEDEWKRLLVPFQKSQVHGNIIIVTTRFPAQAQIMDQKKNYSIHLDGLESKEFEELFLQIIFGDDDQCRKDHSFLHETGFKIAGRLKGSPLAAKTVGRLLKSKLDLVNWTRILESKEWEHSDGKNDIMHALKLSFYYLPSQLQQCFSYCALFPQDYQFERQELINFWIGQDILHSSHGENKRVEDIGLNHLTELVNYGFFIANGFLEKGEEENGMACYTIHDLLHELARKVSSHEFLSIDSSQSQVSSIKVLPSVRHLSINIGDTSANDRLTLKNCVEDFNTLDNRLKVEKLRTLMIFGKPHGCVMKVFGDLFRKAKALRLVFLPDASYDVKDLLHNFHYLIHLRYLRIGLSYKARWIGRSYNPRIPNIISRFYHMKVIDAKYCNIDLLPTDISNLVKLRHLLVQDNRPVQDDTIHSNITKVGKLKSLQELRRFFVKKDDQGFKLRQIGHLEELRGSLCIDSLENVQVQEEADEAKLMLKSHLHELILRWNNNWLTDDSALEKHVLERLKPSCNLQKLSIIGHRGGTCPSWLGLNLSLSSLKSLCLDDVNWKTFPPIGDLWSVNVLHEEMPISIPEKRFGNLRRLELRNLSGLKTWAVHAPCQLFPYLEELIIDRCSQLVELSFSHSVCCCQQGKDANDNLFSKLSKLEIWSCPQLSSFPPVPWTEALCNIKIQKTSSLDVLSYERDYMTIEGNKDTDDSTFWNALAFHNLTGLKHLEMTKCPFPPLRYLQMLPSLRIICISYPSNVFPFVEADCHIKYQFPVELLIISKWTASGKELTQLLVYFPKLSDLQLSQCDKVTGLSVNVRGQHATRTPGPSSLANEVEQQRGARAEDDVIVTPEEGERGLLLLPPQLQTLEIQDCPELSLLVLPPQLQKLCIAHCPELSLLVLPPQLQKLWIAHCPELSLLCSNPREDSNEEDGRSGPGGAGLRAKSLRTLNIINCPKLLSVDLLLLAPQLQKLRIWDCPELSLLCSNPREDSNEEDGRSGPGGAGLRAKSLRTLNIINCPKLLSVDLLLLAPQLQELRIGHCPELSLLCSSPHDDSKEEDRRTRGGGGLQGLTSLKSVHISYCPKLLSFSSSFPFPDSLEHLEIYGAEEMDTMVPLSNLTSLTSLSIYNCGNLRGEGLLPLLTQGHLTYLSVKETPNFFVGSEPLWKHEQKLPSCSAELQKLHIDDVVGFTTAPIRRGLIFSTLTELQISYDDKVNHFTEEQEALLFVNSLEEIRFDRCPFLHYLPKRLHGLRNLKKLDIWCCFTIQLLHEDVLPSSLEKLHIRDCPKIQSLPKDCLPDSLQILCIEGCPAIRSLPEVEDLPSSLRVLDVRLKNSVELKSHCRKLINIIPVVRVD